MKLIRYILVLCSTTMWAFDKINLYNETNKPLFAAVYWEPQIGGKVIRKSPIAEIKPKKKEDLIRPHYKIAFNRRLAFSTDKNDLEKEFKSSALFRNEVPSIDVGLSRGKNYWFDSRSGQVQGFSYAEWRFERPLLFASKVKKIVSGTAHDLLAKVSDNWVVTRIAHSTQGVRAHLSKANEEKVLARYPEYWQSDHQDVVAYVSTSPAIDKQEQAAVERRMHKVAQTLNKKFGIKSNRIPKITFVGSGGGYRSMYSTLGFLISAEKTGLIDTFCWNTSLSGSAWGVAPWMQYKMHDPTITTEQIREQILRHTDRATLQYFSLKDYRLISNLFTVDAAFGKPYTSVNLFGALLANRLFNNFANPQLLYLSDQQKLLHDGAYPIPLYALISGEDVSHHWYSISPWQMSFEPLQQNGPTYSIPTWAMGRSFQNGVSTGYAPEQSLGFMLGCMGSGFAADFKTLFNMFVRRANRPLVEAIVDEIIFQMGDWRLTYGLLPNFMYHVPGALFNLAQNIQLVDAGLDFNMPLSLITGMRPERTADILIIMDTSTSLITKQKISELMLGVDWIAQRQLKFPTIDDPSAATRSITVFKNLNDDSVPVVIYMPTLLDEATHIKAKKMGIEIPKEVVALDLGKCCGSIKGLNAVAGAYTYQEAKNVSKIAELNLLINADVIWNEIASFLLRTNTQ